MTRTSRQIAGWVALAAYLVMGAFYYFSIKPGAGGLWPPDFHLRGYDVASIGPFVQALNDEARASYAVVLQRWDRLFIVSFALWIALSGWRGGGLRYVVAGLAVLYGLIDLAENAAIYQFVFVTPLDPAAVDLASHLTMAKFASLYLSVLVLIWHMRRPG